MSTKPLFENQSQAITVTFHMVQNLATLVGWSLLWGLHIVLALLVVAWMWWHQVTPEQVQSVARDMLGSTTLAVAGAVGVTALGLVSGYVALVRWIWRKTFVPWQFEYLMRGVKGD